MSPGADHLREAEYLLDMSMQAYQRADYSHAAFLTTAAQVHATMALAMATALQTPTGRSWAPVLGVANDGSLPK